MRVFVTGATGNIGSAVVGQLVAAGHAVLGLCRAPDKAPALEAAGGEVLHGRLEDGALLRDAAASCDGVIHLGFKHDFTRFVANCEEDRQVIQALADGLAGSDRPLLVTSGVPLANTVPGEPAREHYPIVGTEVHPRAASEQAAALAAASGVNVSVVRLPQVHDTRSQGLITPMIARFRELGYCAYIGDGRQRWPAAPRMDVARLYRLALERAEPDAKYHAVAEGGVALRDIAQAIARRLCLPVRSIDTGQAGQVFGWMAGFAAHDVPASSELTRRWLGWEPEGPSLLEDLANLELAQG
jgi:nucleoside-diphosphate-sugar epimerase